MNDMCRLVLFVQSTRLCWIPERLPSVNNSQQIIPADAPQISFRRARKDPLLSRQPCKTRSLWLGFNNMLDSLADEASASSNKDNVVRAGHLEGSVQQSAFTFSTAMVDGEQTVCGFR